MGFRPRSRSDSSREDIPSKANHVLHLLLAALLIIALRVAQLTLLQHDQKTKEARRPQEKTVVESSPRATIRDRFNEPLALNTLSYHVAILYAPIRNLPSIEYRTDDKGTRTKIYKRKEYIQTLSQLLGQELSMDASRIEDLIYSKAALHPQIPFTLKQDLSEKEYYRLRMLEARWPGISTARSAKRTYPRGRTASDIIGYMGAINKEEYDKVLQDIKEIEHRIWLAERGEMDLQEEIPKKEDIPILRRRLQELEAKAYTIHDHVGKTGVESRFERYLRGCYGRKRFLIDAKGLFLRELPGGRKAQPGHRVVLTISAELQEYAERLLIENERMRIVRRSNLGAHKKTVLAEKDPWIKGGAIIAMDPWTGELLTLATYPRFDPNDFIASGSKEERQRKAKAIHRWFENISYVGDLWDQLIPLQRERYNEKQDKCYEEEWILSWSAYLNRILLDETPIKKAVKRIETIRDAVILQNAVNTLYKEFPGYHLHAILLRLYPDDKGSYNLCFPEDENQENEEVVSAKQMLDMYFDNLSCNYDRQLLIDLCRLVISIDHLDPIAASKYENISIEEYRAWQGAWNRMSDKIQGKTAELFHRFDFAEWRGEEEKTFLRAQRAKEKESKSYAKPYLDYLDKEEKRLFETFWERHKWELCSCLFQERYENGDELDRYRTALLDWSSSITKHAKNLSWFEDYTLLHTVSLHASQEEFIAILCSFRKFNDLDRNLLGDYDGSKKGWMQTERDLAAAFYPIYGFGYGRSHAYRQATIQGSLFKLVTAYEALSQRLTQYRDKVVSPQMINPLIMRDETFVRGETRYIGYTDDGTPIPQLYKGGRLPRSLAHNNIGRVDLVRALEYSSNPYFSLLAGDCLASPNDLAKAARLFSFGEKTGVDLPGEIAGRVPNDLETNRTGLYAMAIGQHSLTVTPLQTAVMLSAIVNGGNILKPQIVKILASSQHNIDAIPSNLPSFPLQEELEIVGIDFPLFSALYKPADHTVKIFEREVRRNIPMPNLIRNALLKGLKAVTQRTHQENLNSLFRIYPRQSQAMQSFAEMREVLLGKTSTSECVERIDLDREKGLNIYTHVWFGSIAFQREGREGPTMLLIKDEFGVPELVVVVYLRYGGYGKEAAPLAAQIVKKWRDIKTRQYKT